MYKLSDIKTLHLEITEKCQAGCPLCPRNNDDGTINSKLINAELSLNDCRTYFSKPFIKQLRKMFMCGNYGDPIFAKDTLEVFEHFRYANVDMDLDMHTNGGARDKEWWRDLAYVFHTERSTVTFSIDGLSDTNHIYRKRVIWDKVMDSAKSFIEAGGNATWTFIVFKHNEHQIDEARQLSKKMGFKKFIAKKSSRFVQDRAKNSSAILPPTDHNYHNKNINVVQQIVDAYGSLEQFYDTTDIDCKVAADKSIYVSARGLLFPCCWLGGIYNKVDDQLINALSGFDTIDLNKHSIENVFSSGVFDNIKKTWSCNSVAEGKISTCSEYCAKKHDFFKDQFT